MADKSSIVAVVREYLLEPDMSKPLNAIDTLRVHAGGVDGFFGKDEADAILEYLEELLCENDRLQRENEHFTKSGIIEVAVRNISVSDYMDHWEGRALAAESRCEELVKALKRSMVAINDWMHIYAPDMCKENDVAEAMARVHENGTLAYIAGV